VHVSPVSPNVSRRQLLQPLS